MPIRSILEGMRDLLFSVDQSLKMLLAKKTPPKKVSGPRRRVPEDFVLTPTRKQYAVNQGVKDPSKAFAHFLHHHQSKGTVMVDWDKAWQTWCLRQEYFTKP